MRLLKLLLGYSPAMVLLGVAASIVSGLSHAVLLAFVNRALYAAPTSDVIWTFIFLLVLLPLTQIGSTYVLTSLGLRAVLNLRLQLGRGILDAPLARVEALGPHRLTAAITEDASAIMTALRLVPMLLACMTIVLGGMTYLAWLSLPVFLLFLVCLVVGVVTYQVPLMKGTAYQRRVREEADRLWAGLRGIIEGIKELKLHTQRREALLADLNEVGKRRQKFGLISVLYFQLSAGLGQMLVFGLVGVILFARVGGGALAPQALSGYVLVILYLTAPIQAILNSIAALGEASIALRKLNDLGFTLVSSAAPLVERGEPTLSAPERRTLELSGVTYRYGGDDGENSFTLGPLHLRVQPGELLFITGGNGSGKTTLAKILAGLYPPDSGEVSFGDRRITEENVREFVDHLSVVFSDFYLFDSLLGLEAHGLDERAQFWLKRLQLEGKVQVKHGRFSTTALSRGQRKRLALLTAYLEDRQIYVFDEWAADQDPAFKEVFYRELLPELAARGKSVVVISHDDRYYDVGDRIVKLEQGRIVPLDGGTGAGASALDAVDARTGHRVGVR